MEAAETSAPEPEAATVPSGERRCLASGDMLPKDKLIRFVIGPDGAVVPDLAHNLPGRGLWVKADCEAITLAAQKNLFAKAAKTAAKPAADLAALVTQLLRARCLNFIGLAKGAGIAVLGETQVMTALRARKLALLLLSDDASVTLDARQGLPEYKIFTRAELGAALGYAQIVYVGLQPHGLTKRLSAELQRLSQLLKTSPQPIENR